jgi:CYTH domain-containing protein
MNKTALTRLHRTFLIEKLPEPLEPKSAHLQIFDNYIDGTRLRLRLVRDPHSKNWTRILQQNINDDSRTGMSKIAEIHLNENEYSNFEQFEGREIRKNRYFHDFDNVSFAFDVYLGELWGLHMAIVEFEDAREMESFDPPPFAIFEVTGDTFFYGKSLVDKKFDDVQARVSQLALNSPPFPPVED